MIEPFRGNSQNLPLGPKENPEVYKDWKEQLNSSGRRVKSVQARDTFSRVLANIEHSYSEGAYYAIQEKTGIGVTRTMDIENGGNDGGHLEIRGPRIYREQTARRAGIRAANEL
jgi:hypothetical protein